MIIGLFLEGQAEHNSSYSNRAEKSVVNRLALQCRKVW